MSDKLRVLHVIPDLSKGGAERMTLDICREIANRNISVAIVNFREKNDYTYLTEGVYRVVAPSVYIPSISGKTKSDLSAYKKFVKEFNPDVIHSHLFEAEMLTRQVIIPGVKYITHLHDNMSQFKNFSILDIFNKKRLIALYEKKLILNQYRSCGNRFIAISRHTADYFNLSLPVDIRNVIIIHNAIDFERFHKCFSIRNITEPVRLVSTGSLVKKKNQIFLPEVVKILKERGLTVKLDILGDGPCRNIIEQKIKELNLSNEITLRGNVDNVEEYLTNAHIYVHPATYEPFGLAILEAMAAGLPCVMLDGKGNRDIAVNGKNGFLIESANPNEFAEKILQLIMQPGLYRSQMEYAARYAERFDMKNYVDRLLAYYDE